MRMEVTGTDRVSDGDMLKIARVEGPAGPQNRPVGL